MSCTKIAIISYILQLTPCTEAVRGACDGGLTITFPDSGNIYSHDGYGNIPYPSNVDCWWYLEAKDNQVSVKKLH